MGADYKHKAWLPCMLCMAQVNLAYWQATGAQDVISKIVGAYFPVLAFEALGISCFYQYSSWPCIAPLNGARFIFRATLLEHSKVPCAACCSSVGF